MRRGVGARGRAARGAPPPDDTPLSRLSFRHLPLRDVRVGGTSLAAAIAAELGSAVLKDGRVDAASARAALARVSLPLGGGQAAVPLADAIPTYQMGELVRALEDFEGGKL